MTYVLSALAVDSGRHHRTRQQGPSGVQPAEAQSIEIGVAMQLHRTALAPARQSALTPTGVTRAVPLKTAAAGWVMA